MGAVAVGDSGGDCAWRGTNHTITSIHAELKPVDIWGISWNDEVLVAVSLRDRWEPWSVVLLHVLNLTTAKQTSSLVDD